MSPLSMAASVSGLLCCSTFWLKPSMRRTVLAVLCTVVGACWPCPARSSWMALPAQAP